MDPTTYYYTRTEAAFSLDVEAWVQSWAMPASAMLGGSGKEKGSNRVPDSTLSRFRGRSGERVVDLDKLDRPETVHQIAAALGKSMPVANDAKKEKAWTRKISRKVDLREWTPSSR